MSGGELRSIDRYGRATLLAVFLVLLGGRFSLDRLGDYPGWDLRWFGTCAIAVLAYVWATLVRKKSEPAVKLGLLAFLFAAWGGWLLLSSFWAPVGARLSSNVTDLVLLLALVGAGWAVANRIRPRAVQSIWWWLFLAGLAYMAAALMEGPGAQGRYSALGGGPNVFVRVMALATLAALFLAIARRQHWALLGVPVFVAGALLSGSRGGVLSLAAVVAIGAIPLARRMGPRVRGALVMLCGSSALLAVFFFDPTWFTGLGDRFFQKTLVERYDSGRSEILDGAWRQFTEYPVAGVGLDGYYGLLGHQAGWDYPHNLALATAAEGGVIGLAALLCALAAGMATLRVSRPLGADALGFALCCGFMLVASMFSGNYYDSRFLWFFLGLAAIEARRGPDVGDEPRQGHSNALRQVRPTLATDSRDRIQESSIPRIEKDMIL